MSQLKLIVCILTFLSLASFYECVPQPSKVDKFRKEFLILEEKLWNQILDHQDNLIRSDKQDNTAEVQLIREFEIFGDQLYKDFPEDISHGLETLESVWIWARTYSELRGIYALYESFRRFQKLQTAPGRVPSPKQAWIDITEAVLNDGKSSTAQAEDRITEFITKEKLFEECLK
ncbi:hypothetical protein ILUMI_26721, partial [Ignelater luminosus]